MQCTLQVEQQSSSSDNSPPAVPAGQEITGQSVSSLHRLKDINNEGELHAIKSNMHDQS